LHVLVGGAIVAGMSNAWVRGDSLFGFFSMAGLAPADLGAAADDRGGA
jgi:hypothetical protein